MAEEGLTSPRRRATRSGPEDTSNKSISPEGKPGWKMEKYEKETNGNQEDYAVIKSYFLDDDGFVVHGRSYFCLNLCGLTGLLVAFVGLVCGIVVVPGKITNDIYNSFVISDSTSCFVNGTTAPQPCPSHLKYEYFFWNITNPAEFVAGIAPPQLDEIGPFSFKVEQRNYNINFTEGKRVVTHDMAQFFTFLPEKSCPLCTLEELVISPNAVYQGILQSQEVPEHKQGKWETAAGTSAVGTIISGVVDSISAAIDPLQSNPNASRNLSILQWSRGQVFGGFCLPGAPPPSLPPEAYLQYSVWATCIAGQDPSVAFPEAEQAVAIFNFLQSDSSAARTLWGRTLGTAVDDLPGVSETVLLLMSGYIEQISSTVAVNGIATTLGEFLDPNGAGGLLIQRSVGARLFGWYDPLLTSLLGEGPQSMQRIVSGFLPSFNDTVEEFGFGVHPFVNHIKLSTGYGEDASTSRNLTQVMEYNGRTSWSAKSVSAYFRPGSNVESHRASTNNTAEGWVEMMGNLEVKVRGSSGGLHGLKISKDETLRTFDHESFRPMEWSFLNVTEKDGLAVHVYGLANSSLEPCVACPFPEYFYGVQNYSYITGIESIFSRAHFYQAEPSIVQTLGDTASTFNPDPAQHESRLEIEPKLGITIAAQKTYQLSIKLAPTDLLYRNMWTMGGTVQQNTSDSLDFVWVPDFWLRVTGGANQKDISDIKKLVNLERNLQGLCLVVLPLIGIMFIAFSVWNLKLKPTARAWNAEIKQLRMSRAKLATI